MNTQLRKLGMSLVLAVLPMMAATASAQWSQAQSVATATPEINVKPINTVAVSQNGTLVGEIINGQAGLNVFFVRDGQVIKQSQTGSDGSFTIQGLQEGAYSFFAAGQSDFAAYGVYVTGQDNGYSPNVLEVATASPSYSGIQQLVQLNVPTQIRNLVANASRNPATQGITQVRLINGRLNGQINSLYGDHQLSTGVQVQLIKNDRPIAQVETNAAGQFTIPDVAPGTYDFVAASQNGFTATRFEAVGNSPATKVSFRKTATLITACLTCPSTSTSTNANADPNADDPNANANSYDDLPVDYAIEPSYLEPAQYAGESAAYGGASGGSAGGVGNYSNFSGNGVVHGRFGGTSPSVSRFRGGNALSRLLLISGTTLGIIAVSDDGNPPHASTYYP